MADPIWRSRFIKINHDRHNGFVILNFFKFCKTLAGLCNYCERRKKNYDCKRKKMNEYSSLVIFIKNDENSKVKKNIINAHATNKYMIKHMSLYK